MPDTQFKFGKTREEKVDKFLDNLAWFHSSAPAMNYTVNALRQLTSELVQLNKNIKDADKSSTDLSTALNNLTFFGVSIAFLGVSVALVQFLFENKIWPFSQ